MKKPLNIFFEKKTVGTLTKKEDDTLSFQYSRSWLTYGEHFPLSPALALQEKPFNNRQTKAYFDNLLPEGETLKTFERILKRSFENPYQYLENYGLDCAGALEISPLDEPPPPGGTGKSENIPLAEIDSVIKQGKGLYVQSLTVHKGKFSIAGAQDKIPVIFKNGEIFIPIDSTPTTHILKAPVKLPSAVDSVQNEFLCMSLARLCGLDVPNFQVIGKQTPLFLIERYDRRARGNDIERIHQFDLCQAQGYPASEKYEEDGGPTFGQDYKCIESISDNKINDLETSLNWLAFNILIGNNDSHSKNLSFLYENGETKVAPLYDLLSTSIYRELAPEFAFKIGGQRLWHQLKRKNFEMLAKDLGFVKREEIVIEKILGMAERIESASGKFILKAKTEFLGTSIVKVLQVEIEKRIRSFREKLKLVK